MKKGTRVGEPINIAVLWVPHLPTRYFCFGFQSTWWDLDTGLNIGKLGCLTFLVCDLPHVLFLGAALKVKVDI